MGELFDSLSVDILTLTRILITPASNMRVAFLLYATIGVFLLLVLVIGVMLVIGAPEDAPTESASPQTRKNAVEKTRARRATGPKTRAVVGLGFATILLGVWVAAGFTTSDSGLCKSCHWPAARHVASAKGNDPHAKTDCVSCHESGGIAGRYVTGVPLRALHLALTWTGAGNELEYGHVTSRACGRCHEKALRGTVTNAARGLSVSHAEPLAASASCLDCHTMRNGIVSVHNAGMKQCLRCHDDRRASAKCATCHARRVASAVRIRTTSFRKAQIQEVSCGGCHDEKRDCDPCHGARMPHSGEFMKGVHARAAAADIWFNGGKGCGKCHTGSRNPCTRCHTNLMGKAHGKNSGMSSSHKRGSSAHCNSCHMNYAYPVTRDFCKDLCHSKAAIAASPR